MARAGFKLLVGVCCWACDLSTPRYVYKLVVVAWLVVLPPAGRATLAVLQGRGSWENVGIENVFLSVSNVHRDSSGFSGGFSVGKGIPIVARTSLLPGEVADTGTYASPYPVRYGRGS